MVSSSQSQGNIRFPVRDYPSIRENFHVIDSRSKVKRDSTVADQKVNAQKVTHFWKILKILGPKIRKIDQKVTHFHEFSGTQNVSLFDHPLYIIIRLSYFCMAVLILYHVGFMIYSILQQSLFTAQRRHIESERVVK